MTEQYMQIFIQEQIRKLKSFDAAPGDDVIQWLYDTETVFDSVQLRPSNKYIAVQSYLIAIAQAYQPSFNRTLSVGEQPSITVQHVNSSSVSPKTTPDSSPTSQDNFSAVIDLNGSNLNESFPPSSKIEKSATPERITNDDQQLTIVVLPEPSSLHQFVSENVTEDSAVDNIPNTSSSIITSTQSTRSSTVAIDNPITCEDELQALPDDEASSYSSNDFGVVRHQLNSVMESVKVNTHVNDSNANIGAYVFNDSIWSK
ncbi:unnamed protein product, partial [Rotaria socialis]